MTLPTAPVLPVTPSSSSPRSARAPVAGGAAPPTAFPKLATIDPPVSEVASLIRRVLHRRASRLAHFGPLLAHDAVWNMLLELLAARVDHGVVSIKCLWVASGLPATTALRWVKHLEDSGHIIRRDDPEDGRRQLMTISDELASRVLEFLRETEV